MVKAIDDIVVGTDNEDDPVIWGSATRWRTVHSRIADEIRAGTTTRTIPARCSSVTNIGENKTLTATKP
jgi:hypothetical protein